MFCRKFFISIFLFSFLLAGVSQVTSLLNADFILPDTVCVGEPVNIINVTTGASTYFWKFCTGTTTQDPLGINLGNPSSSLSIPVFITLVKDNSNYYSFITNLGNGTITRISHGNHLINYPASATNMGNLGVLSTNVRGIQVKKENNLWYGFVVDGNHIFRLDFGNSLTNMPVPNDLGFFSVLSGADGFVLLQIGTSWIGFCASSINSKIVRFNFGTTLTATPVLTDLGNVGNLNGPYQFAVFNDNGNWFILVCNSGGNTISRLDFGNSLLTIPVGTNLGNPGGGFEDNRGIVLSTDCNHITGFVCAHTTEVNRLFRIGFPSGIAGPITVLSIGSTGMLDRPSSFSELIHDGDTVYTFVVNMTNSTLSLLYFPECSNVSIPSSTLKDPPSITYTAPGTYTVTLIADEGLPTQQIVCKEITVLPSPIVNLGGTRFFCQGKSLLLDAGASFSSYVWNTGDTSQTILITQQGLYWVTVSNGGCQVTDSVNVIETQVINESVDTSVCFGKEYFAGGNWQSSSGIYKDTLNTLSGCDSVITTHLTVKPKIPVYLGQDSALCTGADIFLDASIPGATAFQWNDGSTDSILDVTRPGIYWVHVSVDNCTGGDTITFHDCPPKLWFPQAFTPNGDGLNDLFRPVGVSISKFYMIIFDRWGQVIYETSDIQTGWDGTISGSPCPAANYSFSVTYETTEEMGIPKKKSGTFVLIR